MHPGPIYYYENVGSEDVGPLRLVGKTIFNADVRGRIAQVRGGGRARVTVTVALMARVASVVIAVVELELELTVAMELIAGLVKLVHAVPLFFCRFIPSLRRYRCPLFCLHAVFWLLCNYYFRTRGKFARS
jgi:hypothetical protein